MASLQEVELKLEIGVEAAEALVASGLLPLPASPAVRKLRSIYFDTPDHDLSTAGLSLRIRETPDGRIQTVKAAGAVAAGLFARPEWERSIDSTVPVLDDATPIRALLGMKVRDIGPIFIVEVERSIWTLPWDDALIEVALDRGAVVAGERSTPVSEVELELKKGSPAALFSLARRIASVVPVRLGVLNKAERGFRLLGPAMRAVKAEPVALAPEMTAADAFHRVAGACLRQFRLNEPLIDHMNDKALHQARVALRRLRSAFSIFRPMLADEKFEHLRGEFRWLAGSTGDARDLDVLCARADTQALRMKLADARLAAYEEAESALASARARAAMLDLSEWLVLGDWLTLAAGEEPRNQPAGEFAAAALDRFHKKVRKGGANLAEIGDDARHEVRKDAKKLRYAAEFFAPLFPQKRQKQRAQDFLAALEILQDRLGELNDLATAPALVARLGLDDDEAMALGGDAGDKPALLAAAGEALDMLVDAKRFWR